MAEMKKQILQEPCSITAHREFCECDKNFNVVPSTSLFEDSSVSNGSSVSSLFDLVDDASSSSSTSTLNSSSSSSSQSRGPLDDFTELFDQLPIKRGLSMFYQGKSQSFTSLSRVKSIEDVAKKQALPYKNSKRRRRLKACKSYANGLDTHKSYHLPKAQTFKKSSSSRAFSIFFPS